MRKVTKRLLVACVAALAVGACQDSVTIVEPAPPPPPPPPPPSPTVDATVTIQGLRAIPTNQSVNPTAVMQDINVVLNIEEGDNTVTGVDLLFDGAPIGCASISTNAVPGEGVRLSATGGADTVECFWNTDDVVGQCVGDQLSPAFTNGTHSLGARITLSDGTTRTANNEQTVTLVNQDFIMLASILAGSPVIGQNGRPYVGGPTDLVSIAACPVSYNGVTVGELGIGAVTNLGSGDVDFGAGPGLVQQDNAAPFVFDIDPVLNGAGGAAVEDDPTGAGHDFATGALVGPVFDDNGLNVTSQFTYMPLTGMYLDYVGPTVAAGAQILIGGAANNNGHYSAGAFSLNASVSDLGVGIGGGTTFNVNDPSAGVLVSDATGISDLTEDDNVVDADTNGNDTYEVEVVAVADLLGNNATAADLANIVPNPDGPFGVDVTAPVNTNPLPATTLVLNPDADDNGCADVGDCTLMFDSSDPNLASGDPGSGLDDANCAVAGGCTNMIATVTSGPSGSSATLPLNECNGAIGQVGLACTDELVDPDFSIELFGEPDGAYTITAAMQDLATPANGSTIVFTFTLDDTAPVFGALNPAPVGSAGTDANAIVMTIGGSITDANIIDTAVLTVWDAGADVTCGTGDDTKLTVGAGANQVDQNDVDLTNGTSTISFNQSFTIQQPSTAATTSNYCFIISAEDEAVLKDGTDMGNSSSLSTIVAVTWNAG